MCGFSGNNFRRFSFVIATVLGGLLGFLAGGQQTTANAATFGKPDLTNHRTYMVNGLASAMPGIGYGLKNLQAKLGGKYYAYVTPIEASGMEASILRNIQREYKKNPNIKINLIGVSYGGNIATWLATRLAYKKIPVNYLGIIDAPAPSAISSNVHRADNFRCRLIGCIGAPLRRTAKNKSTIMNDFTFRLTHIRLPNDKDLQQRIVGQLTDTPLFSADDFIEEVPPVDPNAVQDAPQTTSQFQNPAEGVQRPGIAKSYLPENVDGNSGYTPVAPSPAAPQAGGANAPMDLLRAQ